MLAPLKLLTAFRLERQSWTQIRKLQDVKLRRVIAEAAKVPFYRNLWEDVAEDVLARGITVEDLARLPVADKEAYRTAPLAERFAAGFSAANCQRSFTSGSSGRPLEFYNSPKDLTFLRMVYLNDLVQAGLKPWDRVAYFKLAPFQEHPLHRFGVAPFFHVNTGMTIEQQADRFLEVRPSYLTGFFSTIFLLTRELESRGIRYEGIRHMMVGGDSVRPQMKEAVRAYFGAAVTEIYSTVEAFTLGRECPEGRLHVHGGEIVVEVERDDGTVSIEEGEGNVLITRLHSEAMPMIRYRIGDRIRLAKNTCRCGVMDSPIIEKILGRSWDYLCRPDGTLFSGNGFVSALEKVSGVLQFQINQTTRERIIIRIVVNAEAQTVRSAVAAKLATAFPEFHCEIELVNEIPLEANGKVRSIKSAVGYTP